MAISWQIVDLEVVLTGQGFWVCVLKSEDCGEHCCSWEFQSSGLDRKFQFLLVFFTCLQGAVVHWPNRIYHCSGSGTRILEKFNTNGSTLSEGQSGSCKTVVSH